jgi:hypothetical protein
MSEAMTFEDVGKALGKRPTGKRRGQVAWMNHEEWGAQVGALSVKIIPAGEKAPYAFVEVLTPWGSIRVAPRSDVPAGSIEIESTETI